MDKQDLFLGFFACSGSSGQATACPWLHESVRAYKEMNPHSLLPKFRQLHNHRHRRGMTFSLERQEEDRPLGDWFLRYLGLEPCSHSKLHNQNTGSFRDSFFKLTWQGRNQIISKSLQHLAETVWITVKDVLLFFRGHSKWPISYVWPHPVLSIKCWVGKVAISIAADRQTQAQRC